MENENNSSPRSELDWNTKGGARKVYVCHKFDCDFETFEPLANCPECGFTILDPMAVKTFGVVLAVLGAILALIGAGLLILVAARLQISGAAKYAVIGLFMALFSAGAVAAFAGTKQAITGNKSSHLIAVFAGIFVILGLLVAIARFLI